MNNYRTKEIVEWLSSNEDLRRILPLTHSVAIVEYDGKNVEGSIQLWNYLNSQNIGTDSVSRIVLCGRCEAMTYANRDILKELFPSACIEIISTNWSLVEPEKLKMHHTLVFHMGFSVNITDYDFEGNTIDGVQFLNMVNKTRQAYYICILGKSGSSNYGTESPLHFREKLRLTDFVFQEPEIKAENAQTKFCQEKQEYMEMCEDVLIKKNTFFQCAEEVEQGCEACNQCSNYNDRKQCPMAQWKIADFYRKGYFVPANDVIAHNWELRAAKQGYKPALVQVAHDLWEGRGCRKSLESAIEIFERFAREGDKHCTEQIIKMSEQEEEIPHIIAIPYIARMAQNGNEDMILKLFEAFTKEKYNLPDDNVQREEWIRQGAENGNPRFVKALAEMYEEMEAWKESYKWYLKLQEVKPEMLEPNKLEYIEIKVLTEGTSDEEIAKKGMNYLYGYNPLERDTRLAFRCLKYAKEQNVALAEGLLGEMYYEGIEVEQDKHKGIELFKSAAEKGDLLSMKKLIDLYYDQKADYNNGKWIHIIGDNLDSKINKKDTIAYYIKGIYLLEGFICKENKNVAFEMIMESAKAGYPPAQYQLAKMYENGIGTSSDDYSYHLWLGYAANNGYYEAEGEYGTYLFSSVSYSDKVKAFRFLRNAFEKGYQDITANWYLAQCYMNGRGTSVDKAKAYPLYIQAAENGFTDAQELLCKDYFTGNAFLRQNYKNCARWGKEAIGKGRRDVRFETAYSLKEIGDKQTAKQIYLELADEGDTASMNNLGCLIESDVEAAEWFLKAADAGSCVAQSNIARYYRYGIGLEKDEKKAIEYYRMSASQDYLPAILALGQLYQYGEGTDVDIDEAVLWYKIAIGKGDISAMKSLADIYHRQYGHVDINRSIYYYKMGAERGDIASLIRLGEFYEDGVGVEKNISKAIYWYRKAALKDSDEAKDNLRRLNVNWLEKKEEDIDEDGYTIF